MMYLALEHFIASPENYREIFAKSVQRIEIEISTYCNRTCHFCPNVILDRRGNRKNISDMLFSNIINQLASISYAGDIHFHRYNEPMADRQYLISRLTETRSALPKAKIEIYTNGDYMAKDYIDELSSCGCNEIVARLYDKFDESAVDDTHDRMKERLTSFGYSCVTTNKSSSYISLKATGDEGMVIHYTSGDIMRKVGSEDEVFASNRGGILDFNLNHVRTSPCMIPFFEMQIETDGTLLPCCNIRSDMPEHRKYVLGKIDENSDIFLAWSNNLYAQWRRSLITIGKKQPPCDSCNFNEYPDIELLRNLDRWAREKFVELGVDAGLVP